MTPTHTQLEVSRTIRADRELALLAGAGILHAERNFAVYATLAVVVGVMGAMFMVGIDTLPGIPL